MEEVLLLQEATVQVDIKEATKEARQEVRQLIAVHAEQAIQLVLFVAEVLEDIKEVLAAEELVVTEVEAIVAVIEEAVEAEDASPDKG